LHSCDFSYLHFEETLKKFKKKYRFSNFVNFSKNDIILRHDIDYSLESALKIAEIEKKLGIKSTFFVLFHAEMYNLFSLSSIIIIKKILEMGHDLGLHYDSSAVFQMYKNSSDLIINEMQTMEQHFKTKIKVVSAHDPTLNEELTLPSNVVNAYSKEFVKERKYLSDSVQYWREGCFCNYIDKFEKFQILIHPIWWTEDNKERDEIMKSLVNGVNDIHKRHINKYLNIYHEYINKEKSKNYI